MRRMSIAEMWRVVITTAEITFRQNATDAFILFGIVVQPLIIAVLALWMLRERGGDYAIFVVVGSGMTGLWSTVLFVSGNGITRERWTGTLEMLVAAPTPMWLVVFGKSLSNVVQALLSMAMSYGVVSLMFGYPLSVAQPILFSVSLLFTILGFISFGLILSALFVISPEVQRWQNGLEFPVYMLSGFLFPIALLPGWATPFSYILSPYWAALALHGTSAGTADGPQLLQWWAMMALCSVVYIGAASFLFKRVLYKARVDATLGIQ